MMVEREIIEALQKATTAAVAASTRPTLPVKYLGITFEIPNDHKYLEIVHIPNNVDNEFWGSEKTYRGLFRLLLHWPIDGAGVYPPTSLMKSISSHFTKGSRFTAGGVSVKIYEEPDLTGMIEQPPELLFPVTIRYMSFQP